MATKPVSLAQPKETPKMTETKAPEAVAASAAGNARVAPQITAATKAVPMPERGSVARGSKSAYNFDSLTEVGMSFGVKNKAARDLSSIISNAHKKFAQPKKDDNGNVIFKTRKVKDAAGNEQRIATDEAETSNTRIFFAIDVDPKKDPDGASVRVFRQA